MVVIAILMSCADSDSILLVWWKGVEIESFFFHTEDDMEFMVQILMNHIDCSPVGQELGMMSYYRSSYLIPLNSKLIYIFSPIMIVVNKFAVIFIPVTRLSIFSSVMILNRRENKQFLCSTSARVDADAI